MEILPIGAQFEPNAGQQSLGDASTLGQEDFLQVLVAQLRNQNPLEPQSDSDFFAQIALFEQLTSLNRIDGALRTFVERSRIGQASGLLGREILTIAGTEAEPITGIVEGVEIHEGVPMLRVGDTIIDVDSVIAVGLA